MAESHYTPVLATVVVCALFDAGAFLLARLWVLPVLGDDWADALIYTTGLVFPLLVIYLTPKIVDRRAAKHRT